MPIPETLPKYIDYIIFRRWDNVYPLSTSRLCKAFQSLKNTLFYACKPHPTHAIPCNSSYVNLVIRM